MTIVRDGWRLEDGYCGQRIVASVTGRWLHWWPFAEEKWLKDGIHEIDTNESGC